MLVRVVVEMRNDGNGNGAKANAMPTQEKSAHVLMVSQQIDFNDLQQKICQPHNPRGEWDCTTGSVEKVKNELFIKNLAQR